MNAPGLGSVLLTPLLRLTHDLRMAGVPVSSSEVIDAEAALRSIEIIDRPQVRNALATTLLKRIDDRAAFDTLFDVHFGIRSSRGPGLAGGSDPDAPVQRGRPMVSTSLDRPGADDGEAAVDPSTELLEALLDALRRGDTGRLRELADAAVMRFGGMEAQPGATERYFLHRVMRALELSRLMADAIARQREDDPTGTDDRRFRAELAERIETFKRLLAEQVRLHMADLRDATDAAEGMRHLAIEETDFLGASPRQIADMREAIRPLARALATRIDRRRRLRRRQGRLDIRRTVRRSMSSGGVPIDPVFRRPRVSRPDLYLLCDVSGSVTEFATFTLTLLQAMHGEFPRMRSFAFVDGIDEVTGHLQDVASFLEVRHVLYRADVVRGDGHSDYGAVLERFVDRYASTIDSRSTVIITGDARSNFRPPGAESLRWLRERARKVYLLDPEPRADWDTTDSIVAVYRPYLDGVFEVRNLRQLAAAILRIG